MIPVLFYRFIVVFYKPIFFLKNRSLQEHRVGLIILIFQKCVTIEIRKNYKLQKKASNFAVVSKFAMQRKFSFKNH
ncbi:hypothetical protein AR546_05245 [Leptospira interrogans serovar Canicola]|uniref:Uncharacterized protein n=1 Tax=Leptospira interrogans str. FPW1039 TaxID=1193040 RepID=A0A0F6IB31_LEPIR|nr:hypothetical protein B2G50_05690 [Leptospira interrogans serovar Canicola]EMJ35256.1 hypothetical protein LEP1GSC079_1022 [Leptospira interrogans str. FPW1039]EMJ50819.1 hypothetical protein LEP1GSC111_2687 [Leptospira interrogans str. UT126]EYU64723.1 hypothetical protein CI00_05585 [Leptospira interrogans serovar Manilae]KAA1268865.1 hypothetical protein C5473_13440 [Leptospira interrogans serovar Weerasinghe]KAA1290909.1 hypothetical protein C4X99_11475 [Leptospira interrogans serovar Ge